MSDQPAARDYPQTITRINHIEPVPRRIRGYLGGRMIFDTVSARYVWDLDTRVDALRSTRSVRIELNGVVLADSTSPVMVFETGLPMRYYINPTDIKLDHLSPTAKVTACPYKGTTGGYSSARIPDPVTGSETIHDDLAWRYAFPTRQLLPISELLNGSTPSLMVSSCRGQRPTSSRSGSPRMLRVDSPREQQAERRCVEKHQLSRWP
jgi:uncharacterized protein (DUF427 family)